MRLWLGVCVPCTTQPGVSWGVSHKCRARAEARCVEHCEVQRRPPCAQVGRRGRHEVLCPCAPHSPAQAVAHVCEEREPHGVRGGVSAAAHRRVCVCDHRRLRPRWQRTAGCCETEFCTSMATSTRPDSTSCLEAGLRRGCFILRTRRLGLDPWLVVVNY